ncbi:ABC transporter ATP-binding protein [Streptomyces sp. NPDC091272]|uniref:ABC transporter ATP-binding protein n=1 Tax=Streptomyces sp. NPDC091272 TaxID=3365981 RepID=UPI00382927ED
MRVDQVEKSYGPRQVLRGVSLSVAPGSVVGLLGENGAGKSTLLKIMVGRLAPDRGTVRRCGRLGYCPQAPVFSPHLSLEQHLRFFQAAYRLRDLSWAYELVEILGCGAFLRERAGALSGGTQQKVNVVLALMHDPPLLVLDEPYQGFDWQTHEQFFDLAATLRDRGRSVLVVSHLAPDRRRFDVLHHLRDGVIHADDPGPRGAREETPASRTAAR